MTPVERAAFLARFFRGGAWTGLRLVVEMARWTVRAQLHAPLRVLAAVGVLAVAAIGLATRLTIMPGLEALLPDSSVAELHRVTALTGGGSTIFVVLEGRDGETLRRYEVGELAGTNLEMSPEDVPAPIDAALIERRLGRHGDDRQRFPGGYYQSADGNTLVVTVRSGVRATDFERGAEAIARVESAVARAGLELLAPGARWSLTGDLSIGLTEFSAIKRDLTDAGLFGAALIVGVVYLYCLRLRPVLALSITMAIGLAWTFGFTQLSLGHLNLATGLLFTIVAGNGVNFGIMYLAGYLEERRRGRSTSVAIEIAHRETWKPTFTAAAAAAAA